LVAYTLAAIYVEIGTFSIKAVLSTKERITSSIMYSLLKTTQNGALQCQALPKLQPDKTVGDPSTPAPRLPRESDTALFDFEPEQQKLTEKSLIPHTKVIFVVKISTN